MTPTTSTPSELGAAHGSAADGYSVHIKGFKRMPKSTQKALGRMFQCIIKKLESENNHTTKS